MNKFIRSLSSCANTAEILELLLEEAAIERLGISSVRYYRVKQIKHDRFLVSVDCAGHEEPYPTRIRLGLVEKVEPKAGKVRTDGSFEVIDGDSRRPIVFQVDSAVFPGDSPEADQVRLIHRFPLRFYKLKSDGCDQQLEPGDQRPPWADIPLVMGGKVYGKLSCSLTLDRVGEGGGIHPDTLARLLQFQELVMVAAPYLESLRAYLVNSPLEEASREIFRAGNYEDLYRYLVEDLRTLAPFNYEAADILVTSRDTLKMDLGPTIPGLANDNELLILRASSSEVNKADKNRAYYRSHPAPRPWLTKESLPAGDETDPEREGWGLTPWVWRMKRPLRLSQDVNDPSFALQLKNYAPPEELVWAKKIATTGKGQGKETIRSMLIVPIFNPETPPIPGEAEAATNRKVIGVIRLVNKISSGRTPEPIEPREEVLLRRIADRCIGPKLMSLKAEVFTTRLLKEPEKLILMRPNIEFGAKDAAAVCDRLTETLRTFFPTDKKLFLLNQVCPDGRSFVVNVIAASTAYTEDREPHALEGSLTGYILDSKHPFVFINDLAFAAHCGRYRPFLKSTRCALGSAIRCNGRDYGAFVILSEEYDIIPTAYGRLAGLIAEQLGQLIQRREIADFAHSLQGITHDIPQLNTALKERLLTGRCTGDDIEFGLRFVNSLIQAYSVGGPPSPLTRDRVDEVDLVEAIATAAEIALLATEPDEWRETTWQDCFQVEGPRVEVVLVRRDFLDAILFNLFKNAIEHSTRSERIRVRAAIEDGGKSLVIGVTNRSRFPAGLDSKVHLDVKTGERTSIPIDPFFRGRDHPERQVGARLVRALCRWHSVRRGDETVGGSLERAEDAGNELVTFTARIPIYP